MSYFDNAGRDLVVFTIFASVVSIGSKGTHYELLVIPAVYIVVGIFVDIRSRRRERMQPLRPPSTSQAIRRPIRANFVAGPVTKPKPHIRLKHVEAKSEATQNSR